MLKNEVVENNFFRHVFSYDSLENTVYRKCRFTRADFVEATITNCDFFNCSLDSMDATSSLFVDCTFTDCLFISTSFSKSTFIHCTFQEPPWPGRPQRSMKNVHNLGYSNKGGVRSLRSAAT